MKHMGLGGVIAYGLLAFLVAGSAFTVFNYSTNTPRTVTETREPEPLTAESPVSDLQAMLPLPDGSWPCTQVLANMDPQSPAVCDAYSGDGWILVVARQP